MGLLSIRNRRDWNWKKDVHNWIYMLITQSEASEKWSCWRKNSFLSGILSRVSYLVLLNLNSSSYVLSLLSSWERTNDYAIILWLEKYGSLHIYLFTQFSYIALLVVSILATVYLSQFSTVFWLKSSCPIFRIMIVAPFLIYKISLIGLAS